MCSPGAATLSTFLLCLLRVGCFSAEAQVGQIHDRGLHPIGDLGSWIRFLLAKTINTLLFLQNTAEGGLATLCLLALWCLAEPAWDEALQQEGRDLGLGTTWSHPYGKIWHRASLGAPGWGRGGRHPWHPNVTCRGTQTTHGSPQTSWEIQPFPGCAFFTLTILFISYCQPWSGDFLLPVWLWPHPWVRRASLPQRPGQVKWGRRNTASRLIHT